MKKISKIVFLTMLSLLILAVTAFSDNIYVINENWDNLNLWKKTNPSGIVTTADNKLLIDCDGGESEISICKLNGVNPVTYMRNSIDESYSLSFDMKINGYYEGGEDGYFTALFNVVSSEYNLKFSIEQDGIHVFDGQNYVNKAPFSGDFENHSYKALVNGKTAEIYRDDVKMLSYEMPVSNQADTKDDVKISSKGDFVSWGSFEIGSFVLEKTSANEIFYDELSDFSKAYESVNMEITEHSNYFFSGKIQADLVDFTKTGTLTYKIPENGIFDDFNVNMRIHGTAQANISISFTDDIESGVWKEFSDNATLAEKGLEATWFFANGGHRRVFSPDNNLKSKLSSFKYMRVNIKPNGVGGGGNATETSPAVMSVEIYYKKPMLIRAYSENGDLSETELNHLGATQKQLTFSFNSVIDESSFADYMDISCEGDYNLGLSEDKKSIVITFENGIGFDKALTVTLNDGITSESGIKFDGLPGTYEIQTYNYEYKLTESNFADDGSYNCKIANASGKDKTVTIITVAYSDGLIKDKKCKSVFVANGSVSDIITVDAVDISECDKLKAFVWDDLYNMFALTNSFEKTLNR